MTQILVLYIILINIVTFWGFGHDKRQARNKGWRLSEKTLFLLAAAGGRGCGLRRLRLASPGKYKQEKYNIC